MKKIFLLLIISLLLVDIVSAVTIQGNIYDFSLKRLNNIIVEINTIPAQREISQNGAYSFEVPQGNYKITAKTPEGKLLAQENITVEEQGKYSIDLIGFIDITSEETQINNTEPLLQEVEKSPYQNLTITLILLVIIVLLIYFKKFKKKQEYSEEVDGLTEKILGIIKKEKRITQKDIRKLIPYSEAKISLVLTELESKNKIEKIKKGRGNIIILKK